MHTKSQNKAKNEKKKYTWLLFDADGTLFNYEIAEFNALKATCSNYNIEFSEALHLKYKEINKIMFSNYEKGKISIKELQLQRFTIWSKELQVPIDNESFSNDYLKNLSNEITLLPGVFETVSTLFPEFNMAIITNGISIVQRNRLLKSGIIKYFKQIVISEEIGVSKPAPAYFELTLNKIGNPSKKEVLIIGDGLSSDIKGANDSGIDSCWVNQAKMENMSNIIPTYTIAGISDLIDMLI